MRRSELALSIVEGVILEQVPALMPGTRRIDWVSGRWKVIEPSNFLGSLLGLHLFFTADDVASIDAPADLIHGDRQAANTAFINISLLYTFLYTFLCHFFYCLLDGHGSLLSLSILFSYQRCQNHRLFVPSFLRSSQTRSSSLPLDVKSKKDAIPLERVDGKKVAF